MAQQLNIVQVTAALVAMLALRLPVVYQQPVDVREIGGKDFNDAGELILKKVAVRVRFGAGSFAEVRDLTLTTLSATLSYQVVCRHESLRGAEEMRNRSAALMACALDELAGARLTLANGTVAPPILIRSVGEAQDSFGPVEDCYAIGLEFGGTTQFPGHNINGVAA